MARLQVIKSVDILRANTNIRDAHRAQLIWLKKLDKIRIENLDPLGKLGYRFNRAYDDYNQLFLKYLGIGILEALERPHMNRPLRMLDDGAGEGLLLKVMKEKLAIKGIEIETTGIGLARCPKLEANADFAYAKDALFYIPQNKQDLIVSLHGALFFMAPQLAEISAMKYAYSLDRGGIAVLCLDIPNGKDREGEFAQKFNSEGFDATAHFHIAFGMILIIKKH